jgi:hypothetical protein
VSLEKKNKSLFPATTTQYGKIFFHLFNEQNGITNTDLCFDGLNVIETHSNMIGTSKGFTLHSTTSEQAPVTGDGIFDLEWTVIQGEVTSSSERNQILSGPGPQPLIIPEP